MFIIVCGFSLRVKRLPSILQPKVKSDFATARLDESPVKKSDACVTGASVLWHRDAGALIEIFLPFEREDEEDCACGDRSLLHCDRKNCHVAATNINRRSTRLDRQSAPCLNRQRVKRKRLNSWRLEIAMTVGDVRNRIDAASSGVWCRPDAAAEQPSLGAIPPTPSSTTSSNQHRLLERQIDRAFFGPFFREKYGSAGDKGLENCRIRYYGPIHPANNAGELAGRRYVHEFNTVTGCTRGWHEILDRMGNVRQVRPERHNGIARTYQFDHIGRYKGSW